MTASPISARERSAFGQFELRRSHLVTGPNPHSPGSARRAAFDAFAASTRPPDPAAPAEQRAAAVVVCGLAGGADEARRVLDVLGLLAPLAARAVTR